MGFFKKISTLFSKQPTSKPSPLEIFKKYPVPQVLVAHHEAGHVLGALAMGIGIVSVELILTTDNLWAGRVKYDYGALKKPVEDIFQILAGNITYSPSLRKTYLNAAKVRYCIAVAGPIAELRFLNHSRSDLPRLKSYVEGLDKERCDAITEFHDQIGIDGISKEIEFEKLIDKLIYQPNSWRALEELAAEILTAKEHQLDRGQILKIIRPEHIKIN